MWIFGDFVVGTVEGGQNVFHLGTGCCGIKLGGEMLFGSFFFWIEKSMFGGLAWGEKFGKQKAIVIEFIFVKANRCELKGVGCYGCALRRLAAIGKAKIANCVDRSQVVGGFVCGFGDVNS